jgi:hypothetical protein
MSHAPRLRPVLAHPERLRGVDPPELADAVEPLLWGWPQLLTRIPASRRVLERELAAGRFPRPIKHIGRRPMWRPADVIRWAEGGKP